MEYGYHYPDAGLSMHRYLVLPGGCREQERGRGGMKLRSIKAGLIDDEAGTIRREGGTVP